VTARAVSTPAARPAAGRERVIIAATLAAATLLGWIALQRAGPGMRAMPGMDGSPWAAREAAGALAMWMLMIPAMMLPVVTPVVQAHATASRHHGGEDALARSGAFVAGYLAVWVPYGVLAAAAQWALHAAALLAPTRWRPAALLTAVLLLVAGGFQLAPLKHACLERCRTPLGFLLTEWRPRWRGALVMGARHGGTCVLCCWAIMALMLVTGAMNLVWMAALTLLALAEQLAPFGHRLARAVGIVMLGWGAWMLVGALA